MERTKAMFRTAAVALGASLLLAGAAHAAACGDEANRLAGEFRMGTGGAGQDVSKDTATVPPTPPVTVESRGLLGTDQVAPPIQKPAAPVASTPNMGVVPPPAADSGRTLPLRGAPDRPVMRPGPGTFSLEDHQKVEALLASAKQADSAGRPQECKRHVEEAKRLLPGK
jgi:hypothetical protein